MSRNRPSIAGTPDRPVCPNGHTKWTASNGYFWCHDCSQLHGVDPEFDELRDPKTGDPIERTEVSAA